MKMNLDIFQNKTFNLLIQKIYSLQHDKEMKQWENVYGEFDKTNYDEFKLDLPSESTFYFGEIIKWTQDIIPQPKRTLLAGDEKKVVEYLQPQLKVENIITTGLLDVDYKWNFENNPPEDIGKFDLIISQAMLEHLINPYKHVCDLINLLNTNGYLIIHTVCPGHPYHRHPIDTMRFYPDWFEVIAEKLNLTIIRKRIMDNRLNHIFYMYQKNGGTI